MSDSTSEGPRLETLLRRLSECPTDFIEAGKGSDGIASIIAILSDHFRAFGNSNPIPANASFFMQLSTKSQHEGMERYRTLLGIVVWLLHDDWFLVRPELADRAWNWIRGESLQRLSEIVNAEQFVSDPDRREELTRNCLDSLGLLPQGETLEQANDRRTMLDSQERRRILLATAAAERRAREVRDAMARKQAAESASRYGE
jgi:hypothetical protein